MQAAFLAAQKIHSSTPDRRLGADGYDLEVAQLTRACAAHGMRLDEVVWTDPALDLAGYDAVLPLGVWDYQDRPDACLALLRRAEAKGARVLNPPPLIEWNIRKTYLRELEARGARVTPTLWLDDAGADEVKEAFARFGVEEIVVKRQVGAGAQGQLRLRPGDVPAKGPVIDRPAMVQPFLKTVQDEGEYSFLFVDGVFSHAVLKRPASGDYRIQPQHGGAALRIDPLPEDLSEAEAVLHLLDERPLYARVDMVRGDDDGLMLMELELFEPFLFPFEGPGFAPMFAEALARRLAG